MKRQLIRMARPLIQPVDQFTHICQTLAELRVDYGSIFKQVNKSETLLWGLLQKRKEKQHYYQTAIDERRM